VTEALALVVVAWIVYVSDALWWVKPERVILWGRTVGSLHAQFGPEYALRGDSGVFIPRLAPPFHINFEVDVTAPGRKAPAEDIVAAARAATVAARPLTRLSILLWGYCFIVAPLLIVTVGLLRVWLPVLVGLFALAIVVVASFARQWRALHPRDPGGWKGEALPMILSPLAAICAADNLTRSACARFDGLAVVAALATRDDFVRIARLYYFAPREEAASAHTARLDSILDPSLRAEILRAPSPVSEEMKGYCPRCHTQLVRDNGGCPECGQIDVIPFGFSMPSGASFDTSR
jgi:hypothetical protein